MEHANYLITQKIEYQRFFFRKFNKNYFHLIVNKKIVYVSCLIGTVAQNQLFTGANFCIVNSTHQEKISHNHTRIFWNIGGKA